MNVIFVFHPIYFVDRAFLAAFAIAWLPHCSYKSELVTIEVVVLIEMMGIWIEHENSNDGNVIVNGNGNGNAIVSLIVIVVVIEIGHGIGIEIGIGIHFDLDDT